jgi:hypothetical protein
MRRICSNRKQPYAVLDNTDVNFVGISGVADQSQSSDEHKSILQVGGTDSLRLSAHLIIYFHPLKRIFMHDH